MKHCPGGGHKLGGLVIRNASQKYAEKCGEGCREPLLIFSHPEQGKTGKRRRGAGRGHTRTIMLTVSEWHDPKEQLAEEQCENKGKCAFE